MHTGKTEEASRPYGIASEIRKLESRQSTDFMHVGINSSKNEIRKNLLIYATT